jgi:hypothetical protein
MFFFSQLQALFPLDMCYTCSQQHSRLLCNYGSNSVLNTHDKISPHSPRLENSQDHCACPICSKGCSVRFAHIQRHLDRSLNCMNRKTEVDFSKLDEFLRLCQSYTGWNIHLQAHTRCFSLICDGS